MAKIHKPRSGSLAFYPRKRAKKETPTFKNVNGKDAEEVKPLNFYGYKVGMTHVIASDMHKKSPTYGQKVAMPVTIIETPPLVVVGIRAYGKASEGLYVLTDVLSEELPKELARRIKTLSQRSAKGKGEKESKESKEKEEEKGAKGEGIDKIKELIEKGKVYEIRLLASMQPKLTTIGKKKPELVEIHLSGSVEKQFEYAKEKLGKEISVKEAFEEKDFLDVKGVTKGKGFQGVVKRFGVKMHRPKAKERRVVGSIGPWHPATVMWTVPRPGQAGYHTRTEYNKKLLKISDDTSINPKGGWKNYGLIKNEYIIVEGSVPGPSKRCVAFRKSARPAPLEHHKIEEVEIIATKQ